MKLTLCYAPQACATVPFITLTEAGADFAVNNLNSRSGVRFKLMSRNISYRTEKGGVACWKRRH